MNLVHLFFSTQGRIGRGTYWSIFGIWFLIDILLRGGVSAVARWSGDEQFVAVFFWAWSSFSVVTYFPMLALLIKRLHDTGRSGFWTVFQHGLLLSMLMLVIAAVHQSPGSGLFWMLAALLCALGQLLVFVFSLLAGEGMNEYGVA